MTYEKVDSVCPHCNRQNRFETVCVGKGCMAKLRCVYCSKEWQEDVNLTKTLAKSAPSAPSSSELSELRKQVAAQFEELSRAINALLELRSRPVRFVANGVEKGDVAQAELTKALNNPKPVTFAPADENAGAGDEATAWNELGKSLNNPRRGLGAFNPFEGEDAGRPGFQPKEAVKVVASGSPDAVDKNGVRKRSKFEPR